MITPSPNHLLLMKGKPAIPPGLFERNDLYVKDVKETERSPTFGGSFLEKMDTRIFAIAIGATKMDEGKTKLYV